MNPHNHPPRIKSVAMDQLPTPRTDWVAEETGGYDGPAFRYLCEILERELLASQARERVLRSALEQVKGGLCYPDEYYKVATQALNHP